MHWGAKRDLRERFAWTFRMEMGLCGRFPKPKKEIGKVTLGITVYREGRRYDEDNFIGGLKPMIDGIRDAGYLRNDSPVWLAYDPKPKQEKGEPRVEIDIKEVS
jgi:Holliday junction resolvase RusA-like endonuclease